MVLYRRRIHKGTHLQGAQEGKAGETKVGVEDVSGVARPVRNTTVSGVLRGQNELRQLGCDTGTRWGANMTSERQGQS